jgi:hypothetical protein
MVDTSSRVEMGIVSEVTVILLVYGAGVLQNRGPRLLSR